MKKLPWGLYPKAEWVEVQLTELIRLSRQPIRLDMRWVVTFLVNKR
jgi:hypothetical protein